MKEIKCTIIQDLLPLYADNVVSEDTKQMVDEHLNHCDVCRQEYEMLKMTLYVPIETNTSLLKRFNSSWLRKKMIIVLSSVVATTLILFGLFTFVLYYEKTIPYSPELFEVEEIEDQLFVHYYGHTYQQLNMTGPMLVEVAGEEKYISFVYYVESIAHSSTKNLFNSKLSNQDYRSVIPDSQLVEEVYYAEFDSGEIGNWEKVLEDAVLIWQRT